VERHTEPGHKSTVLHLKRNMLQSKISYLRLSGATDEEIEAAHENANRADLWAQP
jgi:hypothetical protein